MRAYLNKKSQHNYERVLLAVYTMADADGLFCHATDAEIGATIGHSARMVARHLAQMESVGEVITFGPDDGLARRVIILLDHPKSGPEIARILRSRSWRNEYEEACA